MPNQDTALLLGNFSFGNWEVPAVIDRFGGYQKLVIHHYPGGDVSAQKFGYFPPNMISWSGKFVRDPEIGTIDARMSRLEQMVQLGDIVVLRFSRFAYEVIVHDFIPTPELTFDIPYRIELIPLRDLNRKPGPPTAPANTQELQKLAGGIGQAPGSPVPAPNVVAQNPPPPTAPGPNIQPPGVQPPIPTPPTIALTDDLTSFQSSLFKALQASTGGGATNLTDFVPLQDQADSIRTQLGPLIAGSDTGLAAFASNTDSSLKNIQGQIPNASTGVVRTTLFAPKMIQVVNPNLPSLAQQYYGDANQWPLIAGANNYDNGDAILVPNPIGSFTEFAIPYLPK